MPFIADYLEEIKRQSARGRCLHYEKGIRCDEYISAHSIQRSGQLKAIAEGGKVYRLSADYSILKRTGGRPGPKKLGTSQASTFQGFCKHHDAELFKPIDEHSLVPDSQQISLYAYRCVCRELFVKENAVVLMSKFADHPEISKQESFRIKAMLRGHSIGLHGINFHKTIFDQTLKNQDYDDFEYIVFTSRSPCNLQMSGLLYPDYDFLGYKLQDLGQSNDPLQLITFFTAPTKDGWAYAFAWHKSSNAICSAFVHSLGNVAAHGKSIEDALLRFSISCCENHAIRISWWDGLIDRAKNSMIERMSYMADPNSPVHPAYLSYGCESIADWSFEYVYSTTTSGSENTAA